MGDLLNLDSKFMVILNRIMDAVILGALWFVCCMPVITIGVSSTAFYYAFHKVIRQRRGYAWQEFFSAFKSNFKQSTIMWLIMLFLFVIIGLDCFVLISVEEPTNYTSALFMIIVGIAIAFVVWILYMFPYLARFTNSTKVMMKNSALIALANLPWSVVILALFIAAALVCYLLPVGVFVVPAIYMWVVNKILERIFRKYMTEEDRKKQEELEKRD